MKQEDLLAAMQDSKPTTEEEVTLPEGDQGFNFEIKQHLKTLDTNKKGWQRQLNLVSYNKAEPVFDIRQWSPEGKMSKGITMNAAAFGQLCQYIIENQDFFKRYYEK